MEEPQVNGNTRRGSAWKRSKLPVDRAKTISCRDADPRRGTRETSAVRNHSVVKQSYRKKASQREEASPVLAADAICSKTSQSLGRSRKKPHAKTGGQVANITLRPAHAGERATTRFEVTVKKGPDASRLRCRRVRAVRRCPHRPRA